MKTTTYSESRQRYAEVLDSVVITRSGRESAVILSLEDYESLRETAYLMRLPANARRLLDAIPEGPQSHQQASRGHPAQQQ